MSAPRRLLSASVPALGQAESAIHYTTDISASRYIVARDAQPGLGEISIDLAPERLGRCYESFFDSHRSKGNCPIVATSFSDVLQRLLDAGGANFDATRRLVVATGIASIWTRPAAAAAAAHRELTAAHPGRFLLGLGVSHEQIVDREQAGRYSRPVQRMREYLDALDSGPHPVPREERVLAAQGPRMLALARDRSAGAHPYNVTVKHTTLARDELGPNRLLAPEQAVVLETDPVRARAICRRFLARNQYLHLPNYTNNWLRLGFTADDLAGGGSDRLVDGLVAWGTVETIRNRIAEHHRAGADHVCIQVVTEDDARLPRDEWRTLAAALRPASVRR